MTKFTTRFAACLLAGTLVACSAAGENADEAIAEDNPHAAKIAAQEGKWSTTFQLLSVKGEGPEVAMMEQMKGQVGQYSMCLDPESSQNTILAALEAQGVEGCIQEKLEQGEGADEFARATLTCKDGDGVETGLVVNGAVYESKTGFNYGVTRTVTNPETGQTIESIHQLSGKRTGDC